MFVSKFAAIVAILTMAICAHHGTAGEGQTSSAKGLSHIPVFNVSISRVPNFGFRSTFGKVGDATGEMIHEVTAGTPAERMKLHAGDAILAVNGSPLRTANSWYDAIADAHACDGWVTLKIRCNRTSAVHYRTANILAISSR